MRFTTAAFLACLLIGCTSPQKTKTAATHPLEMSAARVKILSPDQLQATPIEKLADYPEWLSGATIYACVGRSIMNGLVEFEVLESGYLFLAVNFSYQGNASGGWTNERWHKQDFINNGWTFVEETINGPSANDQRTHELCGKVVKKGEIYRIRCNKYMPPFPIESPVKPSNEIL